MRRNAVTYSEWPWAKSLALADPDAPVQIDRILFGTVRDYCTYIGIQEGSMVTCLDHDDESVTLELSEGNRERLPREYAWFILVNASGA